MENLPTKYGLKSKPRSFSLHTPVITEQVPSGYDVRNYLLSFVFLCLTSLTHTLIPFDWFRSSYTGDQF